MAKRDRVLRCFPSFYRTMDRTKLFTDVVTNLAQCLEEADAHLFRIQRAHRLKVAEHSEDIVRLAASLNLTPFHFEDLLSDKSLSYDARLDLMRSRTQRIARLHLLGLGTPWAVLEATAIFLNGRIVPERSGEPLIAHLDGEYYSHQAMVEFANRAEKIAALNAALQTDLDAGGAVSDALKNALVSLDLPVHGKLVLDVIERGSEWNITSQADGRVYGIRKEQGALNIYTAPRERIYLHEGLFHRRKVEPVERWQLNSWVLANSNVDPAPARLVIEGVSDHTVRPSIFCVATGEGIWFDGVVPPGKTLVIDPLNGAELDGEPVDDWLVSFKGGIHDYARSDSAAFVTEHVGAASAPFLGEMEDVIASAIRTPPPLPKVPVGRSEWAFKVAEGIYGASGFDLAVFEPPSEPVGQFDGDFDFDACVFDFPAAGIAGMGWDESIPCAFKVLLPPQPAQETSLQQGAAAPNSVSRVGAILPGFKAAGIKAIVDTARDAWILGESILRQSSASDGDGVARRATYLRNPYADRLVPLDAVTGTTSPSGGPDGR